jgi:hypothetical protein
MCELYLGLFDLPDIQCRNNSSVQRYNKMVFLDAYSGLDRRSPE